jgi:hypothetical protein
VREIRTLGSAEEAQGNRRPYSNITIPDRRVHHGAIWLFTMAGMRTFFMLDLLNSSVLS